MWDQSTNQIIKTFTGYQAWVFSVAASPSGQWISSDSEDRTIRLWNTQTGVFLTTWNNQEPVYSIAFSSDGQFLASSSGQIIKLREVKTGDITTLLEGHTDWVRCVAFSPDGKLLASGSADHTVRLWDIKTARSQYILQGTASEPRILNHPYRLWIRWLS